jgi:hypothetical protein
VVSLGSSLRRRRMRVRVAQPPSPVAAVVADTTRHTPCNVASRKGGAHVSFCACRCRRVATVIVLLAAVMTVLLPCCTAQQEMPFASWGGNIAPSVPTVVTVSVYLDRLLEINDNDYAFTARSSNWSGSKAGGGLNA